MNSKTETNNFSGRLAAVVAVVALAASGAFAGAFDDLSAMAQGGRAVTGGFFEGSKARQPAAVIAHPGEVTPRHQIAEPNFRITLPMMPPVTIVPCKKVRAAKDPSDSNGGTVHILPNGPVHILPWQGAQPAKPAHILPWGDATVVPGFPVGGEKRRKIRAH